MSHIWGTLLVLLKSGQASDTQPCTHFVHAHKHTHVHTDIHTQTYTHVMHTQIETHTHARTHICTKTLTTTGTHMYMTTHSHARVLQLLPKLCILKGTRIRWIIVTITFVENNRMTKYWLNKSHTNWNWILHKAGIILPSNETKRISLICP